MITLMKDNGKQYWKIYFPRLAYKVNAIKSPLFIYTTVYKNHYSNYILADQPNSMVSRKKYFSKNKKNQTQEWFGHLEIWTIQWFWSSRISAKFPLEHLTAFPNRLNRKWVCFEPKNHRTQPSRLSGGGWLDSTKSTQTPNF